MLYSVNAGISISTKSRPMDYHIAYSAAAAGFAITSAIVFFIVAVCCLCRCYHRKKSLRLNMIKTLRPSVITTYKKPDHIYDEIDHDILPKQEMRTKKNEAYYSSVK